MDIINNIWEQRHPEAQIHTIFQILCSVTNVLLHKTAGLPKKLGKPSIKQLAVIWLPLIQQIRFALMSLMVLSAMMFKLDILMPGSSVINQELVWCHFGIVVCKLIAAGLEQLKPVDVVKYHCFLSMLLLLSMFSNLSNLPLSKILPSQSKQPDIVSKEGAQARIDSRSGFIIWKKSLTSKTSIQRAATLLEEPCRF